MKQYAVIVTPRAERQLAQLYGYIADQSGEARAANYVGKIVAACHALSTFPERGGKRDDVRPNLRTLGYAKSVTIAFSRQRHNGSRRHSRRVLRRAGFRDVTAPRRRRRLTKLCRLFPLNQKSSIFGQNAPVRIFDVCGEPPSARCTFHSLLSLIEYALRGFSH